MRNKNNCNNSNDYYLLKEEYKNSLERLNMAEHNFKNAEPDFFDLANAELTCCMMRVDALRKSLIKNYRNEYSD